MSKKSKAKKAQKPKNDVPIEKQLDVQKHLIAESDNSKSKKVFSTDEVQAAASAFVDDSMALPTILPSTIDTIPPVKITEHKVDAPKEYTRIPEPKPKVDVQINEVIYFLADLSKDRRIDMIGFINAHSELKSHGGMSNNVRYTCDAAIKLVQLIVNNNNKSLNPRTEAIKYLEQSLR